MARRGENIHKRKDGRWEGRYIKARTPEGKIQWGYVYGTVYAEVKRVLIQKKAEAGFYNLKRTDLTFEALAEVWLRSLRNSIKESTYAHYSYTLHKYLLPVLSKVPVASLDESFLEQAMQQIIAPIDAAHKPLGNSSARECLSMLRRICKYAAHLRLIRPMELEVALPKAIDKISAPLSPAEQQRLHQYVQANPTPRKIGLLLGLELGLRIGEICGLQWGDINWHERSIHIQRNVVKVTGEDIIVKETKTVAGDRYVYFPLEMESLLREFQRECAWETETYDGRELEDSDYIFRRHGGRLPMTPSTFTWRFKLILKKHGLPTALNVHSLRHTNASLLIAGGADVATVAGLLGHSQPSTTLDIYTHAFDKNKKAASQVLQEGLEI